MTALPEIVFDKVPTAVTSRRHASFFLVSRPAHGELCTGADERGNRDE
jgi:hypothetical protein